jgi:Terminase DNA packaging enzyme.
MTDKISTTLGVRSLAEIKAEEAVQTDAISGTVRGFGSDREQDQVNETGSQSEGVCEEHQLEKDSQTEGSQEPQNGTEIVEGSLQLDNPPATIEDDENLKDLELARQNVQNIIELGDDAVKEMVEIAKQSESPRAFEVVSTLMKTLLDANKDYVDISSKKKFAKDDQVHGRPETNITNNNLIVSTADLLKMIKGENE